MYVAAAIFVLLEVFFHINGNKWGNLAKHKPTYSSDVGTYIGGTAPGYPWTAVDGNKDTNTSHGSCFTTIQDWFPWWVVDLEDVYIIKSVEVTTPNVGQQKFSNVTIEMSYYMDGDPSFGVMVNPVLCHFNLEKQLRSTTVKYPCYETIQARYVKIWRHHNGKVQPLPFCEAEVHGTEYERYYENSFRPGKRSQNPVVGSLPVRSTIQCSVLCRQSNPCTSFNIQSTTNKEKTCELIADPKPWIVDNEVTDPDWTHYVLEI